MSVKQTKKPNETDRLENYRFEALMELGLAADDAMNLMHIADVVHAATKLANQGCPPNLIASLLED